MKKIIYIILLSIVSGFAITACTEEGDATPVNEFNGGGGASDPK